MNGEEIKKIKEKIKIENISFSFEKKTIFKNFCFSIEENKTTAILAPSGAGKTTLLNLISGLLPVASGKISFFNEKTEDAKNRVSYLFQEPRLLDSATILKNCTIPLKSVYNKTESIKVALHFLEMVGLASRKNDLPQNLSGGEKQRCALARSFAYPSNVLLMDEAFQSQDANTKAQLIELFRSLLREQNRTVLFVTHDLQEAFCLADRIVVLNKIDSEQNHLCIKLDIETKNCDKALIEKQIIKLLAS